MFFKLLVFVVCCTCLGSCANNQPNKQTNVLSASSTVPPTKKIDDKDYWDTDDFVPYKEDRHDTFDWKLFREILLKEQSNVVVSPFSVKLVLTLLSEAAGIDTKTQQELNSVYPHLKDKLHIQEVYRNYLSSLSKPSEHYTLNVGTKLFMDNFVEPKQRYAAKIKNVFNADVERLNFSDGDGAADAINGWVSNATNGHIKDIVSRENVQNSVMLIINAIFFEGLWKSPFNETFQNPFLKTTDKVKADFISTQNKFFFFDSTKLDAKIIRLPYKGKKFSMTIVMPNAVGAIDQLIQEIEGDGLKRLQWLMDEVPIKLSIPKFKIDFTSQLKPVLEKLGIQEMFTDNASLPGIDRGDKLSQQLKVSNIVQKAGLIVDEKGTTAFASTKVEFENKFGKTPVQELFVNRPFVFFIEDETTGNMLFFGKIIDPTI